MSDVKTFYFGNEGANANANGLLASVLPALQNRGIDTGYLLGMLNNGNNGGLFGGRGFEDIIALIIVAAIFGNGNFGFGNNGNNSNTDLLSSMVQRNGVDLSQLAQTINVSNDRLRDAIGAVSTQICNFAGQNGLSFQQVINSILTSQNAIASQICSCCCDVKQLISESNYLTERGFSNTNQILSRGFSDIGYAFRDQTCNIEKAISGSTAQLTARLDAMEKTSLLEKIDKLREDKSTLTTQLNLEHQNNYTAGVIAQSVAPINAAVAALQSDIDSIKCKLPRTETIVAQPNYIPVTTGINLGLAPYVCGGYSGYNGCGYNYGC